VGGTRLELAVLATVTETGNGTSSDWVPSVTGGSDMVGKQKVLTS